MTTDITDEINPGVGENDRIGGYLVKRVAELEEIKSVFYELEHEKTGARHIHISNDDKENTFGVAFKTVPQDSTGVAHILEHTALCGSEKYDVRDPFFSMLKRSLSTFMNAFTSSDWTMYPFSTENRKDFYNLMDVYLDAAFFPKLDALSFKQEGHRIETEKGEDGKAKLVYKGVVYNEMKGAMSSQDQVMGRSLLKEIYPDTTYSNNSGGEPSVIPELTHEDLVAFHKRHYHPSNAFFYTYGNIPLRDQLQFLEERVLGRFDKIDPETEVPNQPRWDAPKKSGAKYPLSKNEDTKAKSQVCLAWLTSDIKDSFEVLTLTIISQVLLGNSASPLRKALIDSKIGTALCDATGFDGDNRDTMFACGLKGVEPSDAPEIEKIIIDVLTNLAENGIEKELIDSAIHQIEFHKKEVTNSPYPYGIKLLLYISGSWFHGGDPEKVLRIDDDLDRLNEAIKEGQFLEKRIKEYFIDNPHRVLFTLSPDQEMEEIENKRVGTELEKIMAGLKADDIAQIEKESEVLKELQESKEDLSSLPTLELTDIPPEVKIVKPSGKFEGQPAVYYDQPTSGIFYFTAAMGAGHIDSELLYLVPFFTSAVSRMGTKKRDYAELARLIDASTGGLGLGANARTRFENSGSSMPFVSFSSKCLDRNITPMFGIIRELLSEYDFSDTVRLKSLLLEYRAGIEASVVQNGHSLAISLAARNFSQAGILGEMWNGVHQLRFVKDLTDDLSEEKLSDISKDLTRIAEALFNSGNIKIAVIGGGDSVASSRKEVEQLTEEIGNSGDSGFVSPEIREDSSIPFEGWYTNSAVSFVAASIRTVRMDHEDAPVLSVISKLLRSMYLHREIREKGGAYGGFSIYNAEDGIFSFGSYRDPHIRRTLKVYDEAADFILSGDFTDEDVKEAILQVCSGIDKPDTPGPAARKAFFRDLITLSDDMRRKYKKDLLLVTKDKVMETAAKYFGDAVKEKAVAVISGEEKLKSVNNDLEGMGLDLKKI